VRPRGPERPEKVIGWSDCRITDETADAYDEVIGAIDNARLPFLRGTRLTVRARAVRPARPGGEPSGHWGRDRRRRGPGRRGARGQAGRDRGRTAVPAVDTPTRQAYVRAGL